MFNNCVSYRRIVDYLKDAFSANRLDVQSLHAGVDAIVATIIYTRASALRFNYIALYDHALSAVAPRSRPSRVSSTHRSTSSTAWNGRIL